jgi:hypothetical protein
MPTQRGASGLLSRLPAQPEVFIALYAFLLNFVWEMWQVPFFRDIGDGPHWSGVISCTQATFGDAAIALFAYGCVALSSRARFWLLAPARREIAAYLAIGLAVTIVFEALATGPLERWRYSEAMPTLPWLGTGVLPLAQWLALPPLVLWLARGQIRGARSGDR